MCDYSLELYRSRKAQRDETLVLDQPSSWFTSKGFFSQPVATTAREDLCAVCIAPGTILSLDCPDGTCHFGVFDTLPTEAAYVYRDGIITQGKRISLQDLAIGTKATIHMPAGVDIGEPGPDHDKPEDADLASPQPSLGELLVGAVRRAVTFVD